MYVIAGKFKCKPEKKGDLLAVVENLLGPSRLEEGCLSYDCYEDATSPGNFLFFEEWRSREDIDLHFTMPYFTNAMTVFPDLVIGAPEIKIYKVDTVENA